jgi:hypothetical protein
MTIGALQSGRPLLFVGSGAAQQILPRDGVLLGIIYTGGGTSPTISLYDSATTAGANSSNQFVNGLALQSSNPYTQIGAALVNGLVANITSGANVSFIIA